MRLLLALGPVVLFAVAIRLIGGRLASKAKGSSAKPADAAKAGGVLTG